MRSRWAPHRRILAAGCLCLLLAATALAQFGGGPRGPFVVRPNIEYDGRFTFVRVNYTTAPGGYWYRRTARVVARLSARRAESDADHERDQLLDPRIDEINALTLDDPELFKYPVAYIIEVGWWTMTDRKPRRSATYLKKGGFVIVDDFKTRGWRGIGGGGWEPFEENMKRVLPEARFFDMDDSHPIFHSFFEIDPLDIIPQAYNGGRPIFRGVYEDNDPAQAAADDRQLQHRRLAVLGVVGTGTPAGGRHQRGLQARRQLHHLRHDALVKPDGIWYIVASGLWSCLARALRRSGDLRCNALKRQSLHYSSLDALEAALSDHGAAAEAPVLRR